MRVPLLRKKIRAQKPLGNLKNEYSKETAGQWGTRNRKFLNSLFTSTIARVIVSFQKVVPRLDNSGQAFSTFYEEIMPQLTSIE